MSPGVLDVGERIRLVTGLEDDNIGLLQYRLDGQWGSVCSKGWTETDAALACSLLGFPSVFPPDSPHYSILCEKLCRHSSHT